MTIRTIHLLSKTPYCCCDLTYQISGIANPLFESDELDLLKMLSKSQLLESTWTIVFQHFLSVWKEIWGSWTYRFTCHIFVRDLVKSWGCSIGLGSFLFQLHTRCGNIVVNTVPCCKGWVQKRLWWKKVDGLFDALKQLYRLFSKTLFFY